MKARVVLFDDDVSNLNLYHSYFSELYICEKFSNPTEYERALEFNPDIIILDVMMPLSDGPKLYHRIITHSNYNGCPILFISDCESEETLMKALECGGQGVLSHSMAKEEIIFRVKNQIEYFRNNRSIYILGEVKVDMKSLKAFERNDIIELTLTELKILKTLLTHYPKHITRDEITHEIWPGLVVQSNTLNTHLSNLRGKFSQWSYEILHVKNHGILITPKS